LNPGVKASCQQLLAAYKGKKVNYFGERLQFEGVDQRDVYNITAPFVDGGELVIAGRVEDRESEDSQVIFFRERDGKWFPKEDAPTFRLQDPFVTWIGGELIFGGVEIFPHPENEGCLQWRTLFYRGSDLNNLRCFAVGPDGMKDLRLVELTDGKIGVFTRPQGEVGGRGTIGFFKIPSLAALTIENIERARLLENQFLPEEWGGANEVHLLKNGLLGVLGHIACFSADNYRHYYSMVFPFDPEQESAGPMEIIACREDFPKGPAKNQKLVDVLFSGGLCRNNDGTVTLYVGVSDAEAHRITIPDPFLKYERMEGGISSTGLKG
jgi:hypothetical protein